MKLKARVVFILLACLLALVAVRTGLVKAQTGSPPKHEDAPPPAPRPLIPPGSDPLSLLQSPDAEQRGNASVFLAQSHQDTEDKVQAIAETFLKQSAQRRSKNPNDPRSQEGNEDDRGAKDAITLLWEFRSERSVPFLIDHLTLPVFSRHIDTLGTAYPCAGALASIGLPSLDPLLAKVAQTDDPRTVQLTTYVFVKVLGNSVGAFFIHDRRSRLTDPAAKRRLDRLEHTVRTEKFPY
jgi:hypothetical protein